MSVGLVYQDDPALPAPRPLWGVLVETATGRAWSPSARAFQAAPADPFLPFKPLACPGVNFGGASRLWVEGVPPPWDDGEYYLSVHASTTGPPVARVAVPSPGYVGFGAWATAR